MSANAPDLALSALQSVQKPGLSKPSAGRSQDEARAAAEEFEAQFLSQLVGLMFEGIETDGPFGGGQGEQMMRSLLTDEYAKQMAAQGGIGVADNVMRELLAIQEAQSNDDFGQ